MLRMLLLPLLGSELILCVPQPILTSTPALLVGDICPMEVVLTCTVQDIPSLRWFVNDTEVAIYFPRRDDEIPRDLLSKLPELDIQINSSMQDPTNIDNINATSLLTTNVSALARLGELFIQCGSNQHMSEPIRVNVSARGTPPLSSATECSLVSSSGGLDVSFQWSTPFNKDHAVERYGVTVTPDPYFCSSDQVSPSEDYSCSGLDLEGNYSITASAINCENQEGENVSFNVQPQLLAPKPPEDIEVKPDSNGALIIDWIEFVAISGRCSFSGGINYTLILEDSTGMVEERRVSSDTCSNGSCSTTFSTSSQICSVSIIARNGFGQSNKTSNLAAGTPRLTSTNQVMLVSSVVLLCGAIAGFCIVVTVMKSVHPKGLWIVLLCGVVPIVLLWVAVAFLVGLQYNTCDAVWQSRRDCLIIALCIFSVIFVVTMAVAAIATICVAYAQLSSTPPPTTDDPTAEPKQSDISLDLNDLNRCDADRDADRDELLDPLQEVSLLKRRTPTR